VGGVLPMKRHFLTLVLALACGIAGCSRTTDKTPTATQGACSTVEAPESVVGMGRIEPAGGIVDVAATMGDRLGRLLVKEGDEVKKGEPLAELDSHTLRELELQGACLNVKKAIAADLTTAAQQQKIELLKVRLALTKRDQQRVKALSKDLASDQERERQALMVQQAESELESAQAGMRQLLRGNELGLEGARLDLKRAEYMYDRSQITAPCNGTVLKIHVRSGETITNKPVVQMADLKQMVVVAEVYENEVKYLHVGQQAIVTSKAFPSPYNQKGLQGKVTRIGRMVGNPALKSIDPFAPADRHVVEVRVQLDREGSRVAATLSNLQVDVKFPKKD
jgi:HlyD family secretion protein